MRWFRGEEEANHVLGQLLQTQEGEKLPYENGWKTLWFDAKNQTEMLELINKLNKLPTQSWDGDPYTEEQLKTLEREQIILVLLKGNKIVGYRIKHKIYYVEYNKLVAEAGEQTVKDFLLR